MPRHTPHPIALLATLMLGAMAVAASPAPASAGPPDWRVVATGLDNPRGLTAVDRDRLLVAEGGRGGPTCDPQAVFVGPNGPVPQCVGYTAGVTELHRGRQRRVVDRLPSVAGPDGAAASGANDVSARSGRLSIVIGEIEGDVSPDFGPIADRFSTLVERDRRGRIREVANFEDFERANNPDGGQTPDGRPELESNPHSIVEWRGRRIVADAGANSLLAVRRSSSIRLITTFPSQLVPTAGAPVPGLPPELPAQSVPTSVTLDRKGGFYVGELTGFPFVPGRSRIWHVTPDGVRTVVASGFTNVIDLAVDPQGRLHVLELAKDGLLSGDPAAPVGRLLRLERNGSRTVLAASLPAPGGVAVTHDGGVYVTANSLSAGRGQVLRLDRSR